MHCCLELFLQLSRGFVRRADFFGPAWITTTVSLELFVLYLARTKVPVYSSLTTVLCLFYGASVALPSIIWLAINNWDVGESNITGVTLFECISLSGYSLIIMIPAYILVAMRLGFLSGLGVLSGAAYSATFLHRNLWPVLQASPSVDGGRLNVVMGLWMANHVVIILLATVLFLR